MAERDRTQVIDPSEVTNWHSGSPAWDDANVYRPTTDDPVAVADAAAVRQEQERLAAERQARREARLAALTPAPAAEQAAATPESAVPAPHAAARPARRTTDRFLPSLGLFGLRLAVAAIMGVHGLDKLLNPQAAAELFATTLLPQPQLLSMVVGVSEVAIAIALVFGLLTRLAGFGVALVAGGALAFVLWGPWSPFVAGRPGFVGELEVLLAAAGLLLVCTGAGGWAIDRGFRARRAADKA